jgi:hypothetical protein
MTRPCLYQRAAEEFDGGDSEGSVMIFTANGGWSDRLAGPDDGFTRWLGGRLFNADHFEGFRTFLRRLRFLKDHHS